MQNILFFLSFIFRSYNFLLFFLFYFYNTGSYKIWSTLAAKEDIDPALITIRDAHDLGINSLEFSNQYTVHMGKPILFPLKFFMIFVFVKF